MEAEKKNSIRHFLIFNIYLLKILFTIISLKKMKRFTTIYNIVDDIFFSSFFICLIVLNLLFSSLSLSHISLSFILFSSCLILSFLAAASSFCSRFSSFHSSAHSLNSSSSPSLNSSKFFYWFLLEFALFLFLVNSVVYQLFH